MAHVFQHRELLGSKMKNAKRVDRKALVNRLNQLRFFDNPIFAHLRHPRYKDTVLAKAITEPSLGQKLTCRWCDEDFSGSELHKYTLLHLLVDDGWSLLVLPALNP